MRLVCTKIIRMYKTSKSKVPLMKESSEASGEMSIEEYSRPTKTKQKQSSVKEPSSSAVIERSLDYHVETLKMICQYRSINPAPVDTLGCEQLHDKEQSSDIQKFQILVSLLLSVQTQDETTSNVVKELHQHKLMTPESISSCKPEDLEPIIKKVNYHKKKAQNMVKIANIFLEKGPPKSYEELMEYPGVGVKIATLYFNHAEGKNQGIGVDTHVHRISNRLGWCSTSKPQDTEKSLSSTFPQNLWPVINHALVGFGQNTCSAKKPLCGGCPVRDRCLYYTNGCQ